MPQSKAIISDGTAEERDSALTTLYNVLESSLRLMHPFLPFITEELWQRLPRRPNDTTPSITIAAYPSYIVELQSPGSEEAYDLVLGTAKAIRSLLAEYKIDKGKLIVQPLNHSAEGTITEELLSIKSLSGKNWTSIDIISSSAAPPTGSAVFAVSTDAAVFLKLEGDINIDDEIKKAQQKLKKAADGVTKQRKLVEAEDFKEKVSSAVREEEHKKLAEFEAQQRNYEKTIQQFETMKLGGS
jgi:valyl-tRNA synthetase